MNFGKKRENINTKESEQNQNDFEIAFQTQNGN